MDNAHYAELFLTESREHVSAINRSLLELERGKDAAGAVSAIFRAVHTVKGMSATMGYTTIAELSHELETVLDRVRRDEISVTGELMDLLFRAADVLERGIEAVVAGRRDDVSTADVVPRLRALGPTAGRASPQSPAAPFVAAPTVGVTWSVPPPEGPGTLVRVALVAGTPLRGVRAFLVVEAAKRIGDVSATMPAIALLQAEDFGDDFALRVMTASGPAEIERVIRAAGDVAMVRVGEDDDRSNSPATVVAAVNTAAVPASSVAAAVIPAGEPGIPQQRSVRIDLRRLDSLMNLIGELVITRGRLIQLSGTIGDAALSESVTQASRLIAELRDEIVTSRMVPVWQIFDRFPRLVRDSARALHKQITFTIEGKEIELDRSMLDEIGDPIVHLLRNAVDHGIELPAVRVAAGKPPVGRLQLSATRDRSAVVIRVTDDGRGIDRERVLAMAKGSGIVDAAKTDLSDDELLRLIARPGFSTVERVTNMSGRGVGVDVIYTRVRSLGGAVDIRTASGQGTTVTLRLPLTLAIVRALLARIGDEVYAIPLTHVSETVELDPGVRRTVRGREVLTLRDEVLPLLRLRAMVDLPPATAGPSTALEQVVVVDVADRRAGLVVDELTGQQEIVVKQFDGVREGLSIFGGATILGDGSPALIIDVSSLL